MKGILGNIILVIAGILIIVCLISNLKEQSETDQDTSNKAEFQKKDAEKEKEAESADAAGKESDTIDENEKTEKPVETFKPGEANMKEYFTQIEITEEIYHRIYKKSYKEDCPLPIEDLRYLQLLYYGFDHEIHAGEMIVNKTIAKDTLSVFKELYEIKYPIERIRLVDDYDGDDELSMSDNNTSAFNFRYIDGTKTYSNHAKGLAIDINPLYNPYVRTRDGIRTVLPVNGEEYADRHQDHKYYIKKEDTCYRIFTKYGFTWGGDWKNSKDYQHFEKAVKEG